MQDLFAAQLEALRAASLDRHLREISSSQGAEIEIAGRRLVNFSSNDYLGLANDPRLREARSMSSASARHFADHQREPIAACPHLHHSDFVIPSSLVIGH
jgi:7-keto-8-aminopelargonate synthetase-like enzyme